MLMLHVVAGWTLSHRGQDLTCGLDLVRGPLRLSIPELDEGDQ